MKSTKKSCLLFIPALILASLVVLANPAYCGISADNSNGHEFSAEKSPAPWGLVSQNKWNSNESVMDGIFWLARGGKGNGNGGGAGSGSGSGAGAGTGTGTGTCDGTGTGNGSGNSGSGNGQGGYGPGDGTGNQGEGPQDGTGNGPATGDCTAS